VKVGEENVAQRMPLLQGPVWWECVQQLTILCESMRRTTNADHCSLFFHDTVQDELYARLSASGTVCEIAMPVTLGIAGAAFTTQQSINVADAQKDSRFYPAVDVSLGRTTHAILATPILIGESKKPVGIIEVLNQKSKNVFTEANVTEVEFVARMAASLIDSALDNVRQAVLARAQQVTDHIKGLNNALNNSQTMKKTSSGADSIASDSEIIERRRTSENPYDLSNIAPSWFSRRVSRESIDETLRTDSNEARRFSGDIFSRRRSSPLWPYTSTSVLGKRGSTAALHSHNGSEQSTPAIQMKRPRNRAQAPVFHLKPNAIE